MKSQSLISLKPYQQIGRIFVSAVILFSMMFSLVGCVPGISDIANEIDKTRQTIASESSGWRDELTKLADTLKGMESKVTADTKSILDGTINQVGVLSADTIDLTDAKIKDDLGQAESTIFCTIDFVKQGALEELQYIIDDLKFWDKNHSHLTSKPVHHVCAINPSVLHLYPTGNSWSINSQNMAETNNIFVYGYNFWGDNLTSLELQDANGKKVRNINVSPSYNTHYKISIDFSNEKFPDVQPGWKIVFDWADQQELNTVNLSLNVPSKLQLSNPYFSPSSPAVTLDPTTLTVTVTNIGGSDSPSFTITWQPDSNDGTVMPITVLPLNAKQSKNGIISIIRGSISSKRE